MCRGVHATVRRSSRAVNLGADGRPRPAKLIRAGVPQALVVMRQCGRKTEAMLRRYAIVDERDLRDAVELLQKGTSGGQLAGKAIRAVR